MNQMDYHEMEEDINHLPYPFPIIRWIPLALIVIGVSISCFFWFVVLTDLKPYFELLDRAKPIVPWLVLAFGVGLTFIIAFIARTALIEKQHAYVVDTINQYLQKEITKKEQLIEYKENIEKSLHQDQKLQAIGTLAGGIAHEFNNLLYAIVGYTEMICDDLPSDSPSRKNLNKVLDAAKRGQELISRILSFSRNQNQNQPFEEVDLKKTIDGALSLLRPTIPASVTLECSLEEDLMIEGNPTQLQQVLINLINNAVDAMDGIGDITIETKTLANNDTLLLECGLHDDSPYCKMVICDSGAGMEQHTADRIFEPFFTTKEVGKGTGLGLAIVHSIIEAHEGKIIVKSQLGHGTTFFIIFKKIVNI